MPRFSLELDTVRISCQEKKIQLFVESSAFFNCSDGSFHTLGRLELLKLFSSGRVWVSRGNNYRLDFQIHLNGRRCPQNVTEILGDYIRNAPLWSQVSMEPRLEISTGEGSETSFSIKLYHALPENIPGRSNSALQMVPSDVQAPEKINSMQLERVEVRMKFESLRIPEADINSRSKVPLESLILHREDIYWDRMFNHKEPLQGLSGHQALQREFSKSSYFSSGHNIESLVCEDEDMLDDETIFSRSNTTAPQPVSEQSNRSSPVYHLEQVCYNLPLDEAAMDDTAAVSRFDFTCTCKMADLSLRTLVGGRQTRSQPGIKILKPYVTHPLSEIAPSIWSPGFLRAMSQRSRFLSIISHSLSTSLLRNAQSPSLQRKLKGLDVGKSQSKRDCGSGNHQRRDAADISHSISQTMQAKLWAMMQLCLYDPLAARRLQPSDSEARADGLNGEDVMLDASMAEKNLGLQTHERQSLENELVDPTSGDFEDMSYDNINNAETRSFEGMIGDDPGIEGDDIFDDLFDDNVVGMGGNSFEALSDGTPADITDDEFEALDMGDFERKRSLRDYNLVAFESTNLLGPVMQRIPLPDKQGESYSAGSTEIGTYYESMLV